MDARLRDQHRAWQANPGDEEAFTALLRAFELAGEQDLPMDVLLETPRWKALASFVEGFFLEPLGSEGVTRRKLTNLEKRIGSPLNRAHREALRLLYHRPDVLTDHAGHTFQPLTKVKKHDFRFDVMAEGAALLSRTQTSTPEIEDPQITTFGRNFYGRQTLSEYMHVTALVGNLMRRPQGLGDEGLKKGVRGASGNVASEVVAKFYPALDVQPAHVFCESWSLHGDGDTVLLTGVGDPGSWGDHPLPDHRHRGHSTYLMTRTAKAWARAKKQLGAKLYAWGEREAPRPEPRRRYEHDSAWDFVDRTGRYRSLD